MLQKCKEPRLASTVEQNRVRGLISPDLKIYSKATMFKTGWYCIKKDIHNKISE